MSRPIAYLVMCADLPHHGHVNLINYASQYGNVCIGLLTDSAVLSYKRAPIMTWRQRAFFLRELKNVSCVIPQVSFLELYNILIYRFQQRCVCMCVIYDV